MSSQYKLATHEGSPPKSRRAAASPPVNSGAKLLKARKEACQPVRHRLFYDLVVERAEVCPDPGEFRARTAGLHPTELVGGLPSPVCAMLYFAHGSNQEFHGLCGTESQR